MSTYSFACPSCQRSIKVKPELAGRSAKCPGCSKALVIPKQPEIISEQPEKKFDFDPTNPFADDDAPAPTALPFEQPVSSQLEDVPSPYIPPAPVQTQFIQRTYQGQLPESRSYPALATIRFVLFILAWFAVAAFAIFALVTVGTIAFAFSNSTEAGFSALTLGVISLGGSAFATAFMFCLLIASRELIKVVLDIQENTLESARR